MKVRQEKPKVDNHFLIVAAEVNFVDQLYPSEEACLSEIWRRVRKTKRCLFCGSTRLKLKYGNRIGNCGKCGKKFWLTAGTIFERMRTARPYLVAIHLSEKGLPFSARLLSRVCTTHYSTALQIFKKIMSAVLVAMKQSSTLVSSFEFDALICKRSSETEAREHPVTEQQNDFVDLSLNDSSLEQIIQERVHGLPAPCTNGAVTEFGANSAAGIAIAATATAATATAVVNAAATTTAEDAIVVPKAALSSEEQIYKLVSEQPQSIDRLITASGLEPKSVLAAVSMLELAELVTRLPGDRVILSLERLRCSRATVSSQLEDAIGKSIYLIRKYFHGVSRKYIQLYLAAYWCFVDKGRWAKDAVFNQCCRTASINIKSFVSAPELYFCGAE